MYIEKYWDEYIGGSDDKSKSGCVFRRSEERRNLS